MVVGGLKEESSDPGFGSPGEEINDSKLLRSKKGNEGVGTPTVDDGHQRLGNYPM